MNKRRKLPSFRSLSQHLRPKKGFQPLKNAFLQELNLRKCFRDPSLMRLLFGGGLLFCPENSMDDISN
jgi:hypothetical protein